MAERNATGRDDTDESVVQRRSRQSAREVTEWETALDVARREGASLEPADADRANAGAMVSRAHRAEKGSGQSPGAARPGNTSTRSET